VEGIRVSQMANDKRPHRASSSVESPAQVVAGRFSSRFPASIVCYASDVMLFNGREAQRKRVSKLGCPRCHPRFRAASSLMAGRAGPSMVTLVPQAGEQECSKNGGG